MTHTQLGRLSFSTGAATGTPYLVMHKEHGPNPIAAIYNGEETAAELVRRWNAFEDGGAVALAIRLLSEAEHVLWESGYGGDSIATKAFDALAALIEEAGT